MFLKFKEKIYILFSYAAMVYGNASPINWWHNF